MGEGGGFPQVQVVVSIVSPELSMACLSTTSAPECGLTNLLVGWPSTHFSAESWERALSSSQFRCLSNLDPFWVYLGTWERVIEDQIEEEELNDEEEHEKKRK
jgi:hypothetical protein